MLTQWTLRHNASIIQRIFNTLSWKWKNINWSNERIFVITLQIICTYDTCWKDNLSTRRLNLHYPWHGPLPGKLLWCTAPGPHSHATQLCAANTAPWCSSQMSVPSDLAVVSVLIGSPAQPCGTVRLSCPEFTQNHQLWIVFDHLYAFITSYSVCAMDYSLYLVDTSTD